MHNLLLVGLFLMALVTGIITGSLEQITTLRCVGIMAQSAFTPLQRGMDLGFGESDLLRGVAPDAELIAVLFEKQLRDDTMAQMAILAFILLDHLMGIFHRGVFLIEL
jgi:hypothetical protein